MDKVIEKKKVLSPNELIDYAAGGIVSKEFEHSNAGSMTLFAFDEGQRLSEHSAPYDATLLIIDGEAEVMIDGELYHPNDYPSCQSSTCRGCGPPLQNVDYDDTRLTVRMVCSG